MTDWPARVRSLMQQHGVSRRRLSRNLHLSRQRLGYWLDGRTRCYRLTHLELILAYFGLELDAMYVGPSRIPPGLRRHSLRKLHLQAPATQEVQ